MSGRSYRDPRQAATGTAGCARCGSAAHCLLEKLLFLIRQDSITLQTVLGAYTRVCSHLVVRENAQTNVR